MLVTHWRNWWARDQHMSEVLTEVIKKVEGTM